jgi:hypothetical protein
MIVSSFCQHEERIDYPEGKACRNARSGRTETAGRRLET